MADCGGPGAAAGERHPGELEGAHHQVLEARVAVDALAEIEDEVGPAYPGEPAEISIADRQELDFMPPAPQDVSDFMDVGHNRGHVLGTPLFAARVEENGDFHSGYLRQERTTADPPPGNISDGADEFVVAHSGRGRGLGKTGMIPRVRQN